jgi:hypothetical protein
MTPQRNQNLSRLKPRRIRRSMPLSEFDKLEIDAWLADPKPLKYSTSWWWPNNGEMTSFDEAVSFAASLLAVTLDPKNNRHWDIVDVSDHQVSKELAELSCTDPWSFEALKSGVARKAVTDDLRHVSHHARNWLARFLLGHVTAPNKPAGRKSGRAAVMREIEIGRCIEELVRRGLTATRNEASSNHHSACDAAAKALASLKHVPSLPVTYSGVKKIWYRYRRSLVARVGPESE